MSHDFWYLSRAAGFTAYGLLSISTVLGLMIGSRRSLPYLRRLALFELHRFTAFLALSFSLLHAAALLGDAYVHFTVADLLLPLSSPYRPWATTAGVLALYLIALVLLSFQVRSLIGYRVWRAIHATTFALFALATAHGISAGSDAASTWARSIYVTGGTSVAVLILYRIWARAPADVGARRLRYGAGALTSFAFITLLLAAGVFSLPMRHGSSSSAASVAADDDTPARTLPAPVILSDDDHDRDHDGYDDDRYEEEGDYDD